MRSFTQRRMIEGGAKNSQTSALSGPLPNGGIIGWERDPTGATLSPGISAAESVAFPHAGGGREVKRKSNGTHDAEHDRTLNLPRTAFPMRAHLPRREQDILRYWERIDLYRRAQERTEGGSLFILHDGPPFSDGDIHLGHAFNKILKDFVIKFRSMQGYHAPFVPGWDTHGLPAEITAIRALRLHHQSLTPLRLRRHAADATRVDVEAQREQFRRLGVRGDWEHPYLTLQPSYEAAVLDAFAHLVDADLIYRGLKPVYWCTDCETALAEAEIEYREHEAHSIYVAFAASRVPQRLFPGADRSRMSAVIWTTTPWMLPANVAIAVHPDAVYALVTDEADPEEFTYIVARALVEPFARIARLERPRVVGETNGRELEGAVFSHPFLDRAAPIVPATSVTLEAGTGLVSLATGYDEEDFSVGQRYGLPMVQPIGPSGIYGPEAGPFAGRTIHGAQEDMLARMDRDGTLLAHELLQQQFPHCWRCRHPVMHRAIEQWFFAVSRLIPRAQAAIDGVEWMPAWGRARLAGLLADRPDWCISRRRYWGIPIPAFYCMRCGTPLLTAEAVRRVAGIVRTAGSDVWYQQPAAYFLPDGATCSNCGNASFRKETEIFDVWFDSGCSHLAVLEARPELRWPADLSLEGQDQYRGWFQASLLISVGMDRAPAPYRAVLAHGFVLDQTGETLSKTLGAGIDPREIVNRYGADILRLWVASVDVRADVPISEETLIQVSEAYRRLRNTLRFLLGNLADFSRELMVPLAEMEEIDRWALHRLNALITLVTDAFAGYEFHRASQALNVFCAQDLSAFYLDVAKDWLYTALPDDPVRRSTQTAFYHLAETLAQLLAPILSFTAEEVWQHLPGGDRAPSVQLTDWPAPRAEWSAPALAARWADVLAVRDVVTGALAEARSRGIIHQSQSAEIHLYLAGKTKEALEFLVEYLAEVFLVSAVQLDAWERTPAGVYTDGLPQVGVAVQPAAGARCARCRWWRVLGETPGYPRFCVRCAAVVKALSTPQPEPA
ncbi:MAG: isoleucine--tRNA ligase [Armatimonadota bacterium]